jgi:DnaD/phage-associated family protein
VQHFNGFPPGKAPQTRIPNSFFTDLLPIIDDLGELKVSFYCMWAAQRQEGDYRYVRLSEAMADEALLQGMGSNPDEQVANLQDGFARSVERGTLLSVELDFHGDTDTFYFMNSQQGRNAVKAIEQGNWLPGNAKRPIGLVIEQPDIFRIYEQNIGSITPMIADQLRDAENEYPVGWIEEAIQIAVERNVRNWRYIQVILDRWDKEGKQAYAVNRGHASQSEPADSQYGDKKGDYSDFYDN